MQYLNIPRPKKSIHCLCEIQISLTSPRFPHYTLSSKSVLGRASMKTLMLLTWEDCTIHNTHKGR